MRESNGIILVSEKIDITSDYRSGIVTDVRDVWCNGGKYYFIRQVALDREALNDWLRPIFQIKVPLTDIKREESINTRSVNGFEYPAYVANFQFTWSNTITEWQLLIDWHDQFKSWLLNELSNAESLPIQEPFIRVGKNETRKGLSSINLKAVSEEARYRLTFWKWRFIALDHRARERFTDLKWRFIRLARQLIRTYILREEEMLLLWEYPSLSYSFYYWRILFFKTTQSYLAQSYTSFPYSMTEQPSYEPIMIGGRKFFLQQEIKLDKKLLNSYLAEFEKISITTTDIKQLAIPDGPLYGFQYINFMSNHPFGWSLAVREWKPVIDWYLKFMIWLKSELDKAESHPDQ